MEQHGDICSCGRSRGSEVHAEGAINGHRFEARAEPVLPPIPPPGFYWARLSCEPDRWQPVEVTESRGRRFVGVIGDEGSGLEAVEWGPMLEPPSRSSLADAVELSIVKLSPLPATGDGALALGIEIARALGVSGASITVTIDDGLTVEYRSPGNAAWELYHREHPWEARTP